MDTEKRITEKSTNLFEDGWLEEQVNEVLKAAIRSAVCDQFSPLDIVIPPDLTIDDFYKCVRYGLLHKEEAVGAEFPAAPMDEQVEGQITLEEFYGDLFGKEVEKG